MNTAISDIERHGLQRADRVIAVSHYTRELIQKHYGVAESKTCVVHNAAARRHPARRNDWARTLDEKIVLFMGHEAFGEHQWADTGIFEFVTRLPGEVLRHPAFRFQTPTESARAHPPVAGLDVPHYISWADVERDTSAWLGNPLQESANECVYGLEEAVYATRAHALVEVWRKLLTSDHFYYMCTKRFSDGDVHTYFNPYTSPYHAYTTYMNIVNDLGEQVKQRLRSRGENTRRKRNTKHDQASF